MAVPAAVQVADRTIEVQTLPMVSALGPGEVLLRVEGCGMCGTDVEQYEGAAARAGRLQYPVVPGHETVGRIVEIDRSQSSQSISHLSRIAPTRKRSGFPQRPQFS